MLMFCFFWHRYSSYTTYCHLGTIALHKYHIWACCQSNLHGRHSTCTCCGCMSGLKACHVRSGSSSQFTNLATTLKHIIWLAIISVSSYCQHHLPPHSNIYLSPTDVCVYIQGIDTYLDTRSRDLGTVVEVEIGNATCIGWWTESNDF